MVLEATGIRAGYGRIEVVHGVDISVAAGEVVALLGANGAGKSTLLRSLAGHHRPTAGHVGIAGRPAARAPHRRARQGLGFVGDDRHVLPGLTVRQTARLVGGACAVTAAFPALAALAGRRTELLSGGEQQMLALARALAIGPRILIVDELSLGLAPQARDQLLARLRSAADRGLGALVVEQAALEILAIADRAVVMKRGEIAASGPASAWRDKSDALADLYLS